MSCRTFDAAIALAGRQGPEDIFASLLLSQAKYIVAADGGADCINRLGFSPDLLKMCIRDRQNTESNYRKMQEIERTYNRRRSSRFRETAVAVTVVTVAIALLAVLTVYLVNRFSPEGPVNPDQSEIVLPNFQGSSMRDIVTQLALLEEAGMTIEKRYEESETVLPDIVLRQEPESDGNVKIKPKGVTLTLYISIGKDSESVPNVVGQTSSLADITLRSQGFVVKFTTEASDTVPKGQVIRTVPAADVYKRQELMLRNYGLTETGCFPYSRSRRCLSALYPGSNPTIACWIYVPHREASCLTLLN